MSKLELQNVHKTLGGNVVVNDVSLTVQENEFFVLVGTSGSGKSTLLRIIAGLEKPDQGRVLLDGQDITDWPARERNLGMVFQDYGLYPNMNAYQNIAYGLEARRMPRNEVETRVTHAAQALKIEPLLQQSVVDLSGGEQQRVALARAFAKDASAYLYDEPLSNLDPKLRHQVRRDITAMHRKKAKPSLYVTHNQNEAFAMGDRIGILSYGRLQQVGTVEAIMAQPTNIFVATFFGSPSMNILEMSPMQQGGRSILQGRGLFFITQPRWQAAVAHNTSANILVGIRPSSIVLANQPGDFVLTEDNTFAAEVLDVQPLLGEAILVLRVGNGVELTAMVSELDSEPQVGDQVQIGINLDEVQLFDGTTEQNLAQVVGSLI